MPAPMQGDRGSYLRQRIKRGDAAQGLACSVRRLPQYLVEFDYRSGGRAVQAIRRTAGKWLTFSSKWNRAIAKS
jgi:hypothetical protein